MTIVAAIISKEDARLMGGHPDTEDDAGHGKKMISTVSTRLMAVPGGAPGDSRTNARNGLPEMSVPTP